MSADYRVHLLALLAEMLNAMDGPRGALGERHAGRGELHIGGGRILYNDHTETWEWCLDGE